LPRDQKAKAETTLISQKKNQILDQHSFPGNEDASLGRFPDQKMIADYPQEQRLRHHRLMEMRAADVCETVWALRPRSYGPRWIRLVRNPRAWTITGG
jgi:hypothetical protein